VPNTTVKSSGSADIPAYVARPASGRGAAVVVLSNDANANLAPRCDLLATQGFIGIGAKLPPNAGPEELQAMVTQARSIEGATGKVGVLAFGGTLAYQAACHTDVDCSVGYYPVGIETMVNDAGNIKNWCLLHFAEDDALVPLALQKKIYGALIGIIFYSIYSYKGVGHSFAREGAPTYDKEAADLANARTEKFLKENLA
jgi:carboxymethylenebutenolidase